MTTVTSGYSEPLAPLPAMPVGAGAALIARPVGHSPRGHSHLARHEYHTRVLFLMHTVRGDAEGAAMEGWEAPTGTSPTRPSLQLLERDLAQHMARRAVRRTGTRGDL